MPILLMDGSLVAMAAKSACSPSLADQHLEKPQHFFALPPILVWTSPSSSSKTPLPRLLRRCSSARHVCCAIRPRTTYAGCRQRAAGAQSAGQGVPEPKRGPQVHLVLWRMGDDSSAVWSVPLSFDKVMDSAAGAQQEHEDVHLHDIAWSPKGDRVGILASVRRLPVTAPSTAMSRVVTFLRTYSVQDGRLLSTVPVQQAEQASDFAQPRTLQWLDID